jgi:hypothetical protein
MKLAEALLERKDLKTKVDNLRARAVQSALVQEGDVPAEAPTELLREMNEAIEQLGVLIRRINATNNVTQLATAPRFPTRLCSATCWSCDAWRWTLC